MHKRITAEYDSMFCFLAITRRGHDGGPTPRFVRSSPRSVPSTSSPLSAGPAPVRRRTSLNRLVDMVRTLRRHRQPQNRQLKTKPRHRLYLTTNTLGFCRHESSFFGVFYKQTKSDAVRLKSGTVRRSFSETFHVQPSQSRSTTNTLDICRHGTHEGPSQVADDGHHNLGHLRLHHADHHVLRGGRLLQTQRRFRVGPAPASPSRQQVDVQPRQRVEGLRALRDGTVTAPTLRPPPGCTRTCHRDDDAGEDSTQ